MWRFQSFFKKKLSKKFFSKNFSKFFLFPVESGKVIFQSYRAWKAHFGCLESVFKAFHEYILGIFRKLWAFWALDIAPTLDVPVLFVTQTGRQLIPLPVCQNSNLQVNDFYKKHFGLYSQHCLRKDPKKDAHRNYDMKIWKWFLDVFVSSRKYTEGDFWWKFIFSTFGLLPSLKWALSVKVETRVLMFLEPRPDLPDIIKSVNNKKCKGNAQPKSIGNCRGQTNSN